jgi:hypothetical protein
MTINKFTSADVAALRQQLLDRTPDPFENAEVLRSFLMHRGYGVTANTALDAASKMGAAGCSFATVQSELEAVALVM